MRRLWRKQHGDEHLGEQEAERRSNFVHLKKSFFQIIFDEVRERTSVRIFPAARSAGFQAGKITWESRRKNAEGTFSFHLQRPNAPVEFDEARERTWFGSTLCAASGGNTLTSLDVCCGRRYDRNILI